MLLTFLWIILVWEEHDLLERALIRAAATLPQPVVERIVRGEL